MKTTQNSPGSDISFLRSSTQHWVGLRRHHGNTQ